MSDEILTVRDAQKAYRLARSDADYKDIVDTILRIAGTSYCEEVSVVFNGDDVGAWSEDGLVFAGFVLTPGTLMERLRKDVAFTGCDIENILANGVQHVNIDFNLEKGDE